MTTMTETSKANKHGQDVMVQFMFGTLCPLEDKAHPCGRRCRHCPTVFRKGRLPATTAATAGGADPSRTERPRTRW